MKTNYSDKRGLPAGTYNTITRHLTLPNEGDRDGETWKTLGSLDVELLIFNTTGKGGGKFPEDNTHRAIIRGAILGHINAAL